MNELDAALLSLLIKDSRLSFADIARQLGCSRAHARARVQALLEEGTVEQFTTVVNPEKLGKVTSTFVDLKVKSHVIEAIATELAAQPEVASLYIMSDLQSLHIHTLTDTQESFLAFAQKYLFGQPDIISVECKNLLKRVKHRRGGARL